jgi:hypothetical protein
MDDDLEDLLEIGGDPSFLEQARDEPRSSSSSSSSANKDGKKDGGSSSSSSEFVWDGVIDETAYFDD